MTLQIAECGLDSRSDVVPTEAAQAGAEGWNGDGTDIEAREDPAEVDQARFDVR
jgi:hypothetical protein